MKIYATVEEKTSKNGVQYSVLRVTLSSNDGVLADTSDLFLNDSLKSASNMIKGYEAKGVKK